MSTFLHPYTACRYLCRFQSLIFPTTQLYAQCGFSVATSNKFVFLGCRMFFFEGLLFPCFSMLLSYFFSDPHFNLYLSQHIMMSQPHLWFLLALYLFIAGVEASAKHTHMCLCSQLPSPRYA